MAWTQSDLDAIEKAIATGARLVEYSDKKVEYRSMKEMLIARDLIRKSLGLTADRFRRIKSTFDKGAQ